MHRHDIIQEPDADRAPVRFAAGSRNNAFLHQLFHQFRRRTRRHLQFGGKLLERHAFRLLFQQADQRNANTALTESQIAVKFVVRLRLFPRRGEFKKFAQPENRFPGLQFFAHTLFLFELLTAP